MKKLKNKTKAKAKPRQKRRVQATRAKILNASRKMFAEKGLDLTTIDDITEQADLGKGTFYYHFSDKNDLIAELIEKVMNDLVQAIKERCEGAGDLSALLDTIVRVHIDFFSNRWEDFVLYFQGRADLQLKEGYSGLEPSFLRYLESLEGLVDSVVNYRLPKLLLRRFGYAVAGFVSGYYSFAAISSEGEDVDKSFADMRGAFVASLTKFINEAVSASRLVKDQAEEKDKANGLPA